MKVPMDEPEPTPEAEPCSEFPPPLRVPPGRVATDPRPDGEGGKPKRRPRRRSGDGE